MKEKELEMFLREYSPELGWDNSVDLFNMTHKSEFPYECSKLKKRYGYTPSELIGIAKYLRESKTEKKESLIIYEAKITRSSEIAEKSGLNKVDIYTFGPYQDRQDAVQQIVNYIYASAGTCFDIKKLMEIIDSGTCSGFRIDHGESRSIQFEIRSIAVE